MTKIAYTSDLHIDFYMRDAQCSEFLFNKAFEQYFHDIDSDVLIIAGDLGHYPEQNMKFLDLLRTKYNLSDIITVSGNHTAYRVNDKQKRMFSNGLQKIAYEEDLFKENGIKVLDGNSYDIRGTVIGGSKSWYDGTYYYRRMNGWYNSSNGNLEDYWKRFMNDSRMINIQDFWELASEEKQKFKALRNTCDIMVSHVCPTVSDKYFPIEYQGDLSNTFYCFDFEEDIAEDTKLQAWVYGHTHSVNSYDFFGKHICANPFGYPMESKQSDKELRHLVLKESKWITA